MLPYTKEDLEQIEDATRRAVNYRARDEEKLDKSLSLALSDLSIFLETVPGKDVLDVGCGRGRYSKHFVDAGMNYQGIDLSPEMIRKARRQNPGVSFETMSFRKLQFPDETFDGLWCCCVLMCEPKINTLNVLGEMRRVLRPGGIVQLVVPNFGEPGETQSPIVGGGDIMTHVSLWGFEELQCFVSAANFKIVGAHDEFSTYSYSVTGQK
jgi:ubiquinone/menaquinone biosynthesis C-methylase UbiE